MVLLLMSSSLSKLEGCQVLDDESQYHTLLRNSTRRRIIEILGRQEKIGFKELKNMLGMGVGTVYYHLDMLSSYISQDDQRKYRLTERGRLLYQSFTGGQIFPPILELSETFSHRLIRWLFLTQVFAKTVRPLRTLPFALLILLFGALGSAFASSQSLLFFYSPFTNYQFETTALLYLFNWISLFFFSDVCLSTLFKRVGGDLQLFVCISIASLPIALFPSLSMILSSDITRYMLLGLIIWTTILLSSAYSFSKGLRLDRSIVFSLLILYLNIVVLLATGRLI